MLYFIFSLPLVNRLWPIPEFIYSFLSHQRERSKAVANIQADRFTAEGRGIG